MAAPGLACADKRTGNTQLIDNRQGGNLVVFEGLVCWIVCHFQKAYLLFLQIQKKYYQSEDKKEKKLI